MSYAELTFSDRSRIKRWIQKGRLMHAIEHAGDLRNKVVLDFGAGNGELCKLIADEKPREIICYEPTYNYFREAISNLHGLAIRFTNSIAEVNSHSIDTLFCLEVLEHLSESAVEKALIDIRRILRGFAIISVPIETGPPAIIKGLFRIMRYGRQFDCMGANIAKAALGLKVKNRPFREDMQDYSSYHMGFRHRDLKKKLNEHFTIDRIRTSPFKGMPAAMNSEIYFVVH